MDQGIPAEAVNSLCCSFCTSAACSLLCFLILFGVIAFNASKSEGCGIPVWTWLEVYFALSLLFSFFLMPFFLCLRVMHPLKALSWLLVLILIWAILLASWIIYGYSIYFSEDNNCNEHADTSVALVFMCIFLIFGLLIILVAAILLFAVPIIYCCFIKPTIDAMNDKKKMLGSVVSAIKAGMS